ncbi:MAG: hypothetical protein Q9191_005050 [Dirinaria sp. TL-2023a]
MSMARLPNTREEARLYIDSLPEYDQGKSSRGVLCLHATSAFMKFPFFHTAAALYGPLTEQDKEELWAIGQMRIALLRHVVAGGIHRFQASKWLAKAAFEELKAFRIKWHAFNEDMYRDRQSHTPEPPIVPLWRSTLDGDSNSTEVTQTLDEMLFANLDVTTHVLTWIITLLADNVDAQAELRQEIRQSLDDVDEYLNRKDTFLHYCFWESLRTDVTVDAFAINIRNPFWGKDSQHFRPRRFENITPSQLRYNLFAFGFGTRKCLGQHDGERAVKALVYQLIDRFALKIQAGQYSGGDYKIEEGNWVPLADVILELEPLSR